MPAPYPRGVAELPGPLSGQLSEGAFQPGRDLPVAGDGHQVHPVERPRLADRSTVSQASSTPAIRSCSSRSTTAAGTPSSGIVVSSFAAMPALATTITPAYTGPSVSTVSRPREQRIDVERDLHEQEVRLALPLRQRPQPRRDPDPERLPDGVGERPRLGQHRPHGQVVEPLRFRDGRRTRTGTRAPRTPMRSADRRNPSTLPSWALRQAIDRPPISATLVCHGDARHGCPAMWLSGIRNPDATWLRTPIWCRTPCEIRLRRRLHLADQLEPGGHCRQATTGCRPARHRSRS